MPKINSKRKAVFARVDRELMRDKRLKSNHKLLYSLLCSLGESCENIFPSYEWLAQEIGYDTEGKSENALYMFITRNLEPLIQYGLVSIEKNPDGTIDYNVHDYHPTFLLNEHENNKKSHKNVSESHKNVSNSSQKCEPYIIGEEEYEKEELESPLTPQREVREVKLKNGNEEPEFIPDTTRTLADDFVEFYELYPKKENMNLAQSAYMNLIRGGQATHQQIMSGLKNQLEYLKSREYRFIKSPENWLKAKAWLNQKPPEPENNSPGETEEKKALWHLPPMVMSQGKDESTEDFEARCRAYEAENLRHTQRYYNNSGTPKVHWSDMFTPQY